MKISPVSFYNSSYKPKAAPYFGAIFPNRSNLNNQNYITLSLRDKDFSKMMSHTTDIFREVETEVALSKTLNPDKKTKIKILGCSDGSEAYSYAMALAENMDSRAKKNFEILGVDLAGELIASAKTGRLVLSDRKIDLGNTERNLMGNRYRSIAFKKYLKKSNRPEGFKELLKEFAHLKFMEQDPASKTAIGNGLDWYEVKTDKLPKVNFETGNMLDYLNSTEGSEVEVYVLANSATYLIQQGGKKEFMGALEKIKEANQGKNKEVYFIFGDTEQHLIKGAKRARYENITPEEILSIPDDIKNLGFKTADPEKLRKKGIADYQNTAQKIFKLIV